MKKTLLTLCLMLTIVLTSWADNLTATVNHAMDGMPTGEIHLTIEGGVGPYSIEWTGPGLFSASSPSISGLSAGTYHVKVTDAYCGVAEMDVVVSAKTTSLDQVLPLSVKIYPNPTSGSVTINFDKSDVYQFAVYNVLGQLVRTSELISQSNEVDLSPLVPGLYTIEISNGMQSYIQKLTKN